MAFCRIQFPSELFTDHETLFAFAKFYFSRFEGEDLFKLLCKYSASDKAEQDTYKLEIKHLMKEQVTKAGELNIKQTETYIMFIALLVCKRMDKYIEVMHKNLEHSYYNAVKEIYLYALCRK